VGFHKVGSSQNVYKGWGCKLFGCVWVSLGKVDMGAGSGKVECGVGLFKKGWVIYDVGMLRKGWFCCGFAKVWFGVLLVCL